MGSTRTEEKLLNSFMESKAASPYAAPPTNVHQRCSAISHPFEQSGLHGGQLVISLALVGRFALTILALSLGAAICWNFAEATHAASQAKAEGAAAEASAHKAIQATQVVAAEQESLAGQFQATRTEVDAAIKGLQEQMARSGISPEEVQRVRAMIEERIHGIESGVVEQNAALVAKANEIIAHVNQVDDKLKNANARGQDLKALVAKLEANLKVDEDAIVTLIHAVGENQKQRPIMAPVQGLDAQALGGAMVSPDGTIGSLIRQRKAPEKK